MNGGAQGALHIDAEWGDTQSAGVAGSSAALFGSEYAREIFAAMGENPEPFPFSSAMETAKARGDSSCSDLCSTKPVLQRPACYFGCQAERLLPPIGIGALAIALIVVGALAFTR